MEPFEKQENNGNAVPILYQPIYILYVSYMQSIKLEINRVKLWDFHCLDQQAVMEDGEGLFLREAPSEILRDREVVMAAVKQNGRALEFADETLQEDKECLGKKRVFIFFFY